MPPTVITATQREKHRILVDKIAQMGGSFGANAIQLEQELAAEIENEGVAGLIGHLRLCGAIPESYGHDTSAEKLYAKYTDIVIHQAFVAMGFTSTLIIGRADTADVECVTADYSFVADAKAFRLSRTAKNQKDFKVQALDRWKHGKPFAMLVCPVYQLPTRASQIYQQAAVRSVCLLTYSHLAVAVQYAQITGQATSLLYALFRSVEAMMPSKDAIAYWQTINRTILSHDTHLVHLWREEKLATAEAILIARTEAQRVLAGERERLMRLSQQEAVRELLQASKIENKLRAINGVADNGLLGID